MPGTGAQPRRAEEVSLQKQVDEPGREYHRPIGKHVRLGEVPPDEGSDQTAPAAGPRWLPAVVRGGDRRQDQRDQGGAHAAVRPGHDPGHRPWLPRLRVVSGPDPAGSILRDADEGEGGLRSKDGVAGSDTRVNACIFWRIAEGPHAKREFLLWRSRFTWGPSKQKSQ